MKVTFSFWEVESITPTSTISVFPSKNNLPRSRVLDVDCLQDIITQRAEYAALVPDEWCGQVFTTHHKPSRAVNGFKSLPILMVNRHIGEANAK